MDAAEPFNVPVNPDALGIPVSWLWRDALVFYVCNGLESSHVKD